MRSQLWQVYCTYWTRLLCWLIAFVILVLGTVLVFLSNEVNRRSNLVAPDLRYPSPLEWVSSGPQTRPLRSRPEQVRSLSINHAPPLPFPDLSKFLQLQTLELTASTLEPDELAAITSLPELKSLSLHVSSIPVGALAALGPQLEQLEIPSLVLMQHIEELPSLKNLRLLRVDLSEFTRETFTAIARIPQLRELVVGGFFVAGLQAELPRTDVIFGEIDLGEKELRPIIQHPTLNAVFATWSPRLLRDRRLRSAVHAYPYSSTFARGSFSTPAMLFQTAVAFLLLAQLGAQFVNPGASVIPGYSFPHQLGAGLILVMATFFSTGVMIWCKTASVPAIVISLLPGSFFCLACWMAFPRPGTGILQQCLQSLSSLLIGMTAFPLLVPTMLPPRMEGSRVWFIEGYYPGTAAGLLLAEVALIGMTLLNLRSIGLCMMEAVPTLVGATMFTSQWREDRMYRNPAAAWSIWSGNGKFSNLAYHQNSFWQQVSLLRKANPLRMLPFTAFFLVIMVGTTMLLTPGHPLLQLLANGAAENSSAIVMPLVQGGVMAAVFSISTWYRRRKTFEMEFCRPVSRADFGRQVMWGLALDQLSGLIPVGVLAAVLVSLTQAPFDPSLLFCGLSLGICFYALSSLVIAVKRDWVIYLFAAIGFVCFTIATSLIATAFHFMDKERWASPKTIVWASTLLFVLGIVGIGGMAKLCRNREWSR